MAKNTLIVIFLLMISTVFFLTFKEGNAMSKYEWLPTESAEKKFPMQIVKGHFIFNNGSSIYIPGGKVIENDWGNVGSSHLVGEDLKPLPNKITITWFSFIENKFYSGKFNLPYERIKKLFEEGIESPVDEKHTTYKYIIVGLGLNGEISIWLDGDGITKEVALFQAKETDIEWSRIVNNPDITREKFIELTLNDTLEYKQILESKNHAKKNKPWGRYKIKYEWDIQVTGTAKPLRLWLKTYNGEKEYTNYLKNLSTKNKLRSIAKVIDIDWRSRSGNEYKANISFNSQEIIMAFNKLYTSNPNDSLKIRIEIDDISNNIKVSLTNKKYLLELKKTKINISRYKKTL